MFCLLGMLASPFVVTLFAPGFADYPEQSLLSADLLRITFPYLFFITVVALLSGLLNIKGNFAIGAIIPVVLNICFILSAIYFRDIFDPQITILALSVFIAGLLQFLILVIVAYQRGLLILPRWRISSKNKQQMKKMGKMLIPAILSVSVIQINLLIDMLLASTLPQGSISWLYYGQRLMELPNGVFIVAISTIVLPTFSYLLQKNNKEEFSPHVDRAVLLGIFITLPSMLGLIFLSKEIISLLFQGGAFNQIDVLQSAQALSAYALGLPAFMLIKIYSPCFFAYQNTKTPLICSIIAVIVNISLSLLLIQSFAHIGLAIATSIATWVNALMLYVFLLKEKKVILFQAQKTLCKVLIINAVFALILYQIQQHLITWHDFDKLQQSIILFAIIACSVMLYFLCSLLLRIDFRQWLTWKTNN